MINQHHSVLVVGALVAPAVSSFSITFRPSVLRGRTGNTALSAGFAGVDSYLDSLSRIEDVSRRAGSATDMYLNSLSQLVETSKESTPEEYLSSLSQFADASFATSSSADHVLHSGSFHLADAESVSGETDKYLTSMSKCAETATESIQEDYLSSISKVADGDNSIAVSFSADNAIESGNVYVTEAGFTAGESSFSELSVDAPSQYHIHGNEVSDTILSPAFTGNEIIEAEPAEPMSSMIDSSALDSISPQFVESDLVEEAAKTTEHIDASILSSVSDSTSPQPFVANEVVEASNKPIEQLSASILSSPSEPQVQASELVEAAAKSVQQLSANSVSLTSDSLTSQLSDLSYESLADVKMTNIPVEQASNIDVSTEKLSEMANAGATQMSKLFEQASASVQDFPQALPQALPQDLVQVGKKLFVEGIASLQTFGGNLAAEKMKLVENDMQRLADQPIVDLAKTVVSSLQTVGGFFFKVVDMVLQDLGGTNIAGVVGKAQASASGLVDGAIKSVAVTVDNVGDMSVAQAVETLVGLVITVTRILFTILNAIAKVVSGKGISDLAVSATASVEQEASNVMLQANAAVMDGTSKSLKEVGSMLGDFSHNVGQIMLASVDALGDAIAGSQMLVSDPVISSSIESVNTAVHAAQMSQVF